MRASIASSSGASGSTMPLAPTAASAEANMASTGPKRTSRHSPSPRRCSHRSQTSTAVRERLHVRAPSFRRGAARAERRVDAHLDEA